MASIDIAIPQSIMPNFYYVWQNTVGLHGQDYYTDCFYEEQQRVAKNKNFWMKRVVYNPVQSLRKGFKVEVSQNPDFDSTADLCLDKVKIPAFGELISLSPDRCEKNEFPIDFEIEDQDWNDCSFEVHLANVAQRVFTYEVDSDQPEFKQFEVGDIGIQKECEGNFL